MKPTFLVTLGHLALGFCDETINLFQNVLFSVRTIQ